MLSPIVISASRMRLTLTVCHRLRQRQVLRYPILMNTSACLVPYNCHQQTAGLHNIPYTYRTLDLTFAPSLHLAYHQHSHHTTPTDIFIIVRMVPDTASDPPIFTKHLVEAYRDLDEAKAARSDISDILDQSRGATTLDVTMRNGRDSLLFEGGERHGHSLHIEQVKLKKYVKSKGDISGIGTRLSGRKHNSRFRGNGGAGYGEARERVCEWLVPM
jgi:hypothetical protein